MGVYIARFNAMTNATPADFGRDFHAFIKTEGVYDIKDDSLLVEAQGTPNMTVKVNTGQCLVKNDSWTQFGNADKFYMVNVDSVQNVTIAANGSGNPRIDIICVAVDSGATSDADGSNVASCLVVEGTPAGSPTAPSVPSDHIKLAQIAVADGASLIDSGNITDSRVAIGKDFVEDGWQDANETWTYASADSPTFTFTVSGDVTTKYSAGMRIKLTQTTVKYFIITAVSYSAPNTTITVYGGTDYTLTNATITSPYYSSQKAPHGFPLSPAKWTQQFTDSTQRRQSSPTVGVYYNLGGALLSIPIGVWNVSYTVYAGYSNSSAATDNSIHLSLSTTNNAVGPLAWLRKSISRGASSSKFNFTQYSASGVLELTTKTTYYLNTMTGDPNTFITNENDNTPLFIRAVCAYL